MTMIRIGNGFDVHALKEGLPMWLGGILVNHHSGFVAHSDGDVLIHSLCDALLGAASLGDIGLHFPDTSDDFKAIDSKVLLRECMKLIRAKGYELINCDNTILAQLPKLRPHIDEMRKCLAEVMEVSMDQVSIKASTTERLGFVGREEGVAAMSSVLLTK